MLGEQLQIDGDMLLATGFALTAGLAEKSDKRQTHSRSVANMPVTLRPASTSQWRSHELRGRTKDVSSTGCGIIVDTPPLVGDIYRFLPSNETPTPFDGQLVRCVRCHFVDEEIFEAGFQFIAPQASRSTGRAGDSSVQGPIV